MTIGKNISIKLLVKSLDGYTEKLLDICGYLVFVARRWIWHIDCL